MNKVKYIVLVGLMLAMACDRAPVEGPVALASINDLTRNRKEQSENLFVKINQEIFNKSCNYGECHGGMFEPSLRTLNSAYYSLVYHPIVKNSKDSAYTYRVVPYKPEESVLHERLSSCCFVNTDDRMPIYGGSIPDSMIAMIDEWIKEGAPDQYGNLPVPPEDYQWVAQDTDREKITPGNAFVLFVTSLDGKTFYDKKRLNDDYNKPIRVPANDTVKIYLVSPFGTQIMDMFNDVQPVIRLTRDDTPGKQYEFPTEFTRFHDKVAYRAKVPTNDINELNEHEYYIMWHRNYEKEWMFPTAESPQFFRDNWSIMVDESL